MENREKTIAATLIGLSAIGLVSICRPGNETPKSVVPQTPTPVPTNEMVLPTFTTTVRGTPTPIDTKTARLTLTPERVREVFFVVIPTPGIPGRVQEIKDGYCIRIDPQEGKTETTICRPTLNQVSADATVVTTERNQSK